MTMYMAVLDCSLVTMGGPGLVSSDYYESISIRLVNGRGGTGK